MTTRTGTTAEVGLDTIRERATRFASRYAGASSEQAERQSFWNDFFDIFDVDRPQVAAFERIVQKDTGGRGWVDLLYPGQMAVEHKSAGEDLVKAMQQLYAYLPRLSKGAHPWLLVACDFQTFKWEDLESGKGGEFLLSELPDNVDLFAWIAGHARPDRRDFGNEEEASLEATQLLAVLHDRLSANRYGAHHLREWLTRILFCLFADDTGVWGRAAFHAWVATYTRADGSDLGPQINYLFQILNTPPDLRSPGLDETLSQFTYINGDLFAEQLPIPACDVEARDALLEACKFDWSILSPAIFGSIFQDVMDPPDRRRLGAHYTSERDILRTIEPLFLDELRSDLAAAKTSKALESYLDRLSKLAFFDPACGCGNFLVVAYREVRRLETEALQRLAERRKRDGQMMVDIALRLRVSVDQFYGIEIEEFPAKIARTALYLIDHLANREFSRDFGAYYVRFPIPAAPNIVQNNALRVNWNDILPAEDADFVFGNPPYIGYSLRSPAQQADHEAVLGRFAQTIKKLDYVANWFVLAAEYGRDSGIRFAFVATNSLTQGTQATTFGPMMVELGVEIDFAHRPFKWISEASGAANVHVVIVGFSHRGLADYKRLWEYSDMSAVDGVEANVASINWYLVDSGDVYPRERNKPLSPDLPMVNYGSKPADGGNLIVDPTDYEAVAAEQHAAKYLRVYVGAGELIGGTHRWCLWMDDLDPKDVEASAILQTRIEAVRSVRLASKKRQTREMAAMPHLFAEVRQPETSYVCIPIHVSDSRRYYTVARFEPDVISSNANFTAADPDGFLFAVISSSMFMTWQRAVGGRIKSDPRFSNRQVWHTLPLPPIGPDTRARVSEAGRGVLTARGQHPDRSLAEHYHPLAMSPALVEAHKQLDRQVDRAFGAARTCRSERERLRILFDRYAELTGHESAPTERRGSASSRARS